MPYCDYKAPEVCRQIARRILEGDNFLMVPHQNIDGDDLGCMLAFGAVLKKLGKKYCLYSADGTPVSFRFLQNHREIVTELPEDVHFDTAIVLECLQYSRLSGGVKLYELCDHVVSLDHHPESKQNDVKSELAWIDPSFCALGEMLYFVFREMNAELDKTAAEALYTSMVSDSAGFRYSSVSSRTHRAIAHLVDIIGDISHIHRHIFGEKTLNEIKLFSLASQTLRLHAGGRLVSAYYTKEMLDECGLEENDTQTLISQLNVVRGTEIFAAFKQMKPGEVRVSLRSIRIPVNTVAYAHGGGGHNLAAACTLKGLTIEQAQALILPELEALLNKEA
ncbi:bifunctional oligoribonuclease/PAP phosphatase NrnA [bacterium]|nr:bifunctional oligoribonuclease/PAP phosphatase NrnA [bacterium]